MSPRDAPHRSAPAGAANEAVGLSCRDVSVRFGDAHAVRAVDLEVAPGEWLALIGPNGAGKSTLLRAVAGLVAHEGSIELGDGRRPDATDVAFVPQAPRLPEGMSVVEYVLLGRTAHLGWLQREGAADRAAAAAALRRLSLDGFARRPVRELSGGEAQRVVIARALVQQAPVLLLDEPTSALDVGHQRVVMELVDELRHGDGLTVIAAMHDLTTAAEFADRLVLVDAGTVVAVGPARDVLDDAILSAVYGTPLTVRDVDGRLVVLPATPGRSGAGADRGGVDRPGG